MSNQHHSSTGEPIEALSVVPGSMLFAAQVLSGDHRYSQNDDIREACRKISRRYVELRMKIGFQAASDQAKAEWLAEYLSSNTAVSNAEPKP